MAASVVKICNRAMMRVGSRAFISSLDDDSTEAEVLNVVYEGARDELLELLPWPFAKIEQALAVVEDVERSGWGVVYAVPANALSVRSIYSGTRTPNQRSKIPFEMQAADDLNSRYLVTDLEDAVAIYTGAVTNAAMFSPLFADALAWRIAIDLAMGLPVKGDFRAQAAQGFALAITAAAASMNAQQHETLPDSDIITERS